MPNGAARRSSLAEEWRPGTVFLASSDFTHYGRNFGYVPFPTDDRVAARLRDLDFECIAGGRQPGLRAVPDTLAETAATVCGSDPIALLLDTLRRLRPSDLVPSHARLPDLRRDHGRLSATR